jgi:hypothetical protein
MCRWKDNIKMDLKQDGKAWTGIMWFRIGTKWQAVFSTVQNLQVPYSPGSFVIGWGTHSSSRRSLLHGLSQPASQPVSQSVSQLMNDKIQWWWIQVLTEFWIFI